MSSNNVARLIDHARRRHGVGVVGDDVPQSRAAIPAGDRSISSRTAGGGRCTVPPHIAGTPTTVWVSATNPGGASAFAPAAFIYN